MSLKPWPGHGLERLRRVRPNASHSPSSTDLRHDPSDPITDPTLEMVLAEFSDRWERGQHPRAEDYLDRLPHDRQDDVVELIYHEYCLAEVAGLEPVPDDYLRRFPLVQEPLYRILLLHGTIDDSRLRDLVEDDDLPGVGDEIGPYLLIRELGEGGFAHVFLAEQADLDNRLVVVKISRRITPEPQLLARARHPHIVEILWHGLAEDGTLQLICMPFLGGTTLAAILADRNRRRVKLNSGRDLLAILDRVSAAEYPRPEMDRPARETLARQSYPRAMAWIVARLAEALDHASSRGVAHGDVKPSNILLTTDGVPMLLDFNLAVGWQYPAGADKPGDPGGTLVYMAPERLRGVADPSRSEHPRAVARHRADIYSLGMVLLEALTGRSPEIPKLPARSSQAELAATYARSRDQGGEVMIRSSRTSIPPALRSILARCLAPDPADRYKRGAELADDLDRWRTDRPLAFAKEPAWRPGLVRWARRKRLVLAAAALSLTVAAAATLAVSNAFRGTQRQQAIAKYSLIVDRPDSGIFRNRRGGHWRPQDERDPAETALRHLEIYDVTGPGDWRQRDDVRNLPEDDRAELEAWILEQILRYTRALGDRPDSPDDWRRGLELLEQTLARTTHAPLRAQAHVLAERLGLPDPLPRTGDGGGIASPPRWLEEYLLGIEAEPTRAEEALVHYTNLLADRPGSFWGHYHAAAATWRLSDYKAAAHHLGRCIDQRPGSALIHTLLAGCLFKTDSYAKALEECDRALALDPEQPECYYTRTYIRGRLGQEESEALKSDINQFAIKTRFQGKGPLLKLRLETLFALDPKSKSSETRFDDLSRRILDGDTMAVLGLDRPSARPSDLLRRFLEIEPENDDSRRNLAYELWKVGRKEDAISELDLVLGRDPENLQARQLRAIFLVNSQRPAAADRDFAILFQDSRREEIYRGFERDTDEMGIYSLIQFSRAALRLGMAREALQIAECVLRKANRMNIRQREAHYNLARVHAEASKADPRRLPLAQYHIHQAFRYSPAIIVKSVQKDTVFNQIRPQIQHLLR